MHPTYHRMQRIAEQIQHELALLLGTKAQDPRFDEVTITAVKVSPDMANATVLISQLDEMRSKQTLHALNKAAGFLRSALAKSLNLRVTPKLHFVYDDTISRGNRIQQLINSAIKTNKE